MDAQGAVDSLLGRLTTVLVNEALLLGGVRGDVEFIKDEMESMNGFLRHLSEVQHRDHQVQAWMKQVSDLTRDCDGNVELYIHYVGGGPASLTGDCFSGYLRRILRFLRTIRVRHRIATRIQELKVRARDVGDRRQRYGVTVPLALPDQHHTIVTEKQAPQPGGPEEEEDLQRRQLLWGEPPDTIDVGTEEVLGWLLGEVERSEERHLTIYIVGRGEVGKTAIARRVYEHPSVVSSFQLRAWVNFGGAVRDPLEVFQEIWKQITVQPETGTSTNGQNETTSWFKKVHNHVQDKKCLIVLDGFLTNGDDRMDYWLLRDFLGPTAFISVIFTATDVPAGWHDGQVFDVHLAETRAGFFRRRAHDLAKCPFTPVDEVLDHCYPDVFALKMFLHLLYVNPKRSEMELNSLRDLLRRNRNKIDKTMLMFCYNELPINYKSCLLYLSVFPQDHTIRRTSLLRRWTAEGLISERSTARVKSRGGHGMSSLEDHAERIFDALVNRGFVRPGETSTSGKIKNCTVHHTVQEFITTDVSLIETCLPPDLAHRLSIKNGIAVQDTPSSNHPTDATQTLLESMPQSPQWQLLKVLDLEGCTGLKKKKRAKNICKILRYLSLRKTDVTKIPKQIEKLQCLETLDIRQTATRAFATKSVMLPMLKHFLAGQTTPRSNNSDRFEESFATVRLPSGTRRMKKLEILSHVEVSNSVEDLIDIGQLPQLRKLGVVLHDEKGGLTVLLQQIEKLHGCLRSLSVRINQPVRSEHDPNANVVAPLATPPKLLQSLNISGITNGLPIWLPELDQLSKITLQETFLGEDAIHILGNLRMLRCLRLMEKSYDRSNLNFNAEEFQHLKSLVVKGDDITNISFDTGVAPKLERIIWSFNTMEALSGVNHLLKLKKLELNGDCNLDPVKAALEKHPNHPDLQHNPRHQSQENRAAAVEASSSSAP